MKPYRLRWIASLGAVVFLAAAAALTAAQAPAAPAEKPPAFRLSPGDTIDINFFFNQELNTSAQIRPDGRLNLPLVGDVELAGKSVPQAVSDLDAAYTPHLKTPAIAIVVRIFASQKVYVGGEVTRPGMIPILGDMHVFDAIMEAGGIKTTGKTSSVVLLRRGDDGTRTMSVLRLRDGKGNPALESNMALRPFDVILVPETRIARVDRWVDQHIRQVVPFVLTAGFTYLFNGTVIP